MERLAGLRRHLAGTPPRQFALLSFVVIGLSTLVLCLVISYVLRRDMLDREWRTTADFVRTEAAQGLSVADFDHPWSDAAQRRFRRFFDQTTMMPEIVRVKSSRRYGGRGARRSCSSRTKMRSGPDGRDVHRRHRPARHRRRDAADERARAGRATGVASSGHAGAAHVRIHRRRDRPERRARFRDPAHREAFHHRSADGEGARAPRRLRGAKA